MKRTLFLLVSLFGEVAGAQQDPLEAISLQQVAAQAPGATLVAPFLKGAAPKTDWSLLLTAGNCYWFSAAATANVGKIALFLWAPGKFLRVADAKSPSPLLTMAHCATVTGMYRLEAKLAGAGLVNVGVFGQVAPAGPPPVAPPSLGAMCDQTAAASGPGATRVGDYLNGAGDRADFTIMMEPGRCYWVVGCGEPSVHALSLFLWGPDGKRLTEAKPDNSSPVVGHCPGMRGMHKLQAKVHKGGGRYSVGVYVK